MPLVFRFVVLLSTIVGLTAESALAEAPREVAVDLLVVGGSESAVAAAVQAARQGVKSIALVNDIDWLGGQFTAEGLGAVDEWTVYKGQKVPFPRSGLFLEIMNRIEADMQRKYGLARPGNCWCAWTTCEPRDTEKLFRKLVEPYLKKNGGPLQIFEYYEPERVLVEKQTVRAVEFVSRRPAQPPLRVTARLTIDASDWGDVVRLSGAAYLRGPDLKSRFGEPSAPTNKSQVHPNEMNPLTHSLVLRERAAPTVIEKPPHYDERRYVGAARATETQFFALGWPEGTMASLAPVWVDSDSSQPYSLKGWCIYTHRRLVDRRHSALAPGTEVVMLNWPHQDYPTYDFPAHVAQRLEATAPGASQKNMVDMTPAQRRIVLEDARDHALGFLYYLQTAAYEGTKHQPVTFRNLELTEEFGTPDRTPLKPYLREGLRLEALYMVREQDLRDTDGVQSWAKEMPPDGVFGFQFNIDFHPTRRIYLDDDPAGPWSHIHSKLRNWSTDTDRAMFPLRSLIPVEMNGLLVAGKNLGYSSIVSSAVRLHAHGMHGGQAAATLAALCLKEEMSPREVAQSLPRIREIQSRLVAPPRDPWTQTTPPGLLLWPYQDAPVDAPYFAAANELAVRNILPGAPGKQDFDPERSVTRAELAAAVARAGAYYGLRSVSGVEPTSPSKKFATVGDLQSALREMGWEGAAASALSKADPDARLTRAQFAELLWQAVRVLPEPAVAGENWFTPGHDADGDGTSDLDDASPYPAPLGYRVRPVASLNARSP